MSTSKELTKPDASKPLVKRAKYLTLSEDPELVTVDIVEEIKTDDGQRVRITCRRVIIKKDLDTFEYSADKEQQIKDSNSTSSWYLLTDFKKYHIEHNESSTGNTHWPKEGIFYWVWKASDGIRWETA